MNHTKNLKVKDLKVLVFYMFRSEKLKLITKKVEIKEAVTDFLENIGRVL